MSSFQELKKKIQNDNFSIGILGLGYVGLPLAVLFAQKGNTVLGFEKSDSKTEKVNRAENYIGDVEDEHLDAVIRTKKLSATSDFSRIQECEVLIICVPTPLDRFKKPDMSYIQGACEEIGRYMKPGALISLESTTYPTTTEDFMLPILEKESGLKHGHDFYLCYSPERVDPGNHSFKTENTPKVLGGLGEEASELGMLVYQKAIKQIHKVSSPRIAEMVKILENTYRLVNISLINELTLLAGKMDINMWEVIEAAKTKPFGFQAFYPGPGIGGHCIPLDPFYLEYIAKKYHFDLTMIHTAGHIDMMMPHRMVIKVNTILNRHKKSINGSKIMILGVAYKPDISDERESPALKIMDELVHKGAEVFYHDPHIPEIHTEEGQSFSSTPLTKDNIKNMDLVVIVTNHSVFNVQDIVEKANLVVDMRNAVKFESEKVYKF
ncbi:MAG: nucleotide sugar dehydrogenase [Leptospiraceae bacterium]|nr:nucleotide sugar dehydrogenase [Leptospiraceae bacterium]